MQQMNSVSAENVKAMTRVAEQARATDQEVKQLLEKSQQRFTLMFAASAVVSVLALAMAVFLVMSAGGAQNSQPVISEVSRGETSGGDAVSLWIVEDKGQLDAIPPGVIHTAGANRPHPVIVWRQGGMIYYLTADSLDRAERAAHMLHDQV